ncbi:hypothetical protein HYH03_013083 [Edaphochlamys debaryana]|uniref:Exonuclease domain-containing protein n=1 Tax=Edaphochlamys debaryana TaxID=47281 RepID=A0A835XRG7_9CHLO|nr:hypothetical protein HYH03_013083 [Edaphochlamys debaryana]|eukprot:KAG2488399.1 hypothetical protein HYH03_013083 [Edaphochlamys debaryana]
MLLRLGSHCQASLSPQAWRSRVRAAVTSGSAPADRPQPSPATRPAAPTPVPDPAANMPPAASQASTGGNSSRSRGSKKVAASDPNQPTLDKFFSRKAPPQAAGPNPATAPASSSGSLLATQTEPSASVPLASASASISASDAHTTDQDQDRGSRGAGGSSLLYPAAPAATTSGTTASSNSRASSLPEAGAPRFAAPEPSTSGGAQATLPPSRPAPLAVQAGSQPGASAGPASRPPPQSESEVIVISDSDSESVSSVRSSRSSGSAYDTATSGSGGEGPAFSQEREVFTLRRRPAVGPTGSAAGPPAVAPAPETRAPSGPARPFQAPSGPAGPPTAGPFAGGSVAPASGADRGPLAGSASSGQGPVLTSQAVLAHRAAWAAKQREQAAAAAAGVGVDGVMGTGAAAAPPAPPPAGLAAARQPPQAAAAAAAAGADVDAATAALGRMGLYGTGGIAPPPTTSTSSARSIFAKPPAASAASSSLGQPPPSAAASTTATAAALPLPGDVAAAPAGTKSKAAKGAGGSRTAAAKGASDGRTAADKGGAGGRGAGKGRAAKKAGRCGYGPGGRLLWSELSVEEQAEAADGRCIRWEPWPPEQEDLEAGAGPDAPSSAASPIFHLFAVDIETTDNARKHRGQQRFPRVDQRRLIELAAVDLGPWDAAAPPAPGPGSSVVPGTPASPRVFSTLVNPGMKYKDDKTADTNGITYKEVSAPGVPSAAPALEAFHAFIQAGCATTAAASARTAPNGQPPTVIPLLVAHNGAGFDFPTLRYECGRVGVPWPQDWWYLDTLVMARVLWTKAQQPPLPAEELGDGEEGEEAEEGEEGEDEAAAAQDGGGRGRAVKRGLSMAALRLWAGVKSDGQAHRADVDALDLAGVWVALRRHFGPPSPLHLEALRSKTATKAAAGPMHSLGLVSQSARADALTQHMEASIAVQLPVVQGNGRSLPSFPPPRPAPGPSQAQSADAGQAQPGPRLAYTPAELKQLAEAGRIVTIPARGGGGGGGGGFQIFNVYRWEPAPQPGNAEALGLGAAGGGGGGGGGGQRLPLVVLLRGVKLRFGPKPQFAYKDGNTPRWDMTLQAAPPPAGSSGGGSRKGKGAAAAAAAAVPAAAACGGGAKEGCATAAEMAELVAFFDGLARQAVVDVRGDAVGSMTCSSCGREEAKKKTPGMSVQLAASVSHGPAHGRVQWQVLTSLASYDGKTASYTPRTWPALTPYEPDPSDAQLGIKSDLERLREDNLARVFAQLPDVTSSDVLDVAVWPQFCWSSISGYGVRLTALHIVRRSGR